MTLCSESIMPRIHQGTTAHENRRPCPPNPSATLRVNSVRSLMRGFSRRLRFLAAFGWCRNDMGDPPPVRIPLFVPMTLGYIPTMATSSSLAKMLPMGTKPVRSAVVVRRMVMVRHHRRPNRRPKHSHQRHVPQDVRLGALLSFARNLYHDRRQDGHRTELMARTNATRLWLANILNRTGV